MDKALVRKGPAGIIGLYVISAVLLIGFQELLVSWLLLAASAGLCWLVDARTRHELLAICATLVIIGLTPVNTGLSAGHIVVMLAGMIAAVAVPYLWLERWRHYGTIRYRFHHGRRWYLAEILYVLFPAALGYFVVPYFFSSTGNYHYWHVELTPHGLFLLLLGLVAVGVWDEVVFVATIASVLRRHLPFWLANAAQAFVFSSFLYGLGFRSWGMYFAYIFALIQCYIYKVTNSLVYAITVHVVFDLVLFLALVHAHYPRDLRIFITS